MATSNTLRAAKMACSWAGRQATAVAGLPGAMEVPGGVCCGVSSRAECCSTLHYVVR
jgi:hypothetical protein